MVTVRALDNAGRSMSELRTEGYATAARYDKRGARVVVDLSTGVRISVPVKLAQGLAGAAVEELSDIEISPAGLGLHWPKIDADLYLPDLMRGVFGSRKWMAQVLGERGGATRTAKKAAAARANGKKGGRPRRAA